MMLTKIFFKLDDKLAVVKEDMAKNWLKKDLDLM